MNTCFFQHILMGKKMHAISAAELAGTRKGSDLNLYSRIWEITYRWFRLGDSVC